MNSLSISIKNLSVTFGKNRVLENLNLEINSGEIHTLIGPNGGGKSTFIKALLGQINHQGEIALNWKNGEGVIGYVPQSVAIDKTLPITILDYMAICTQRRPAFLGVSKKVKKDISEVLEKVHLTGKEKYLFSELSGGERQRVLFAQALIPKPDLLILDEPMSSIDKKGAEIFSSIISDFKNEGKTILWVHHDLVEVKERADIVTCINKSIVFSGKPKEVMSDENLLNMFSVMKGE